MTPFHDLHDYMALPRLTGLRLSPDGSWLAATVSALSADGQKFKTSIWRIDTGRRARPAGAADPVGRGRGQPGLPARRLAVLSPRPASPRAMPAARRNTGDDAGRSGRCGCCRRTAARPAGSPRRPAASPAGHRGSAPLAAFTAPVLPGAAAADDAQRRQARTDAGVTAILHETAPVRYWDHDLGPDELRLLVTGGRRRWTRPVAGTARPRAPRDLTPSRAGRWTSTRSS